MLPQLVAHARDQSGAFTAAQVRAAGYTDAERRARLKRGQWLQLRRGIYAERGLVEQARRDPTSWHLLNVQAAMLALGRPAFVSHSSACVAWGIGLLTPPSDVTLTCPEGETHSGHGLTVHVSALAEDEQEHTGDVPVTSLGRTVFDTARHLPFREAVPIADQALRTGKLTVADLETLVKRYHAWPGVSRAGRVTAFADWRSESVWESVSRVFLLEEGFPAPDLQVEFFDEYGLIGRCDFYWKKYRTIGEFDGRVKYSDDGRVLYAEKRREDRLRVHDEVVRFGTVDLTRRRRDLRSRFLAAFERGRHRPPPPHRAPWWP